MIKKLEKTVKKMTTLLGMASATGFAVSFILLESLRPKMVRFRPISSFEESLINFFGVTLLVFLAFSLMAFYRLIKHLKNAKTIRLFYLFLLALNSVSFILIFGDIALISDIGKQYRYHLSQPEWLVLYPIMAGQAFSALLLAWANHCRLDKEKQEKYVAKDSNIFLIAQYVGVICGLLGLNLTGANFFFPRSLWMVKLHVNMTAVFLMVPYLLVVGSWLMIKIRENPRGWYDEKQILDIGRSSFITLLFSSAVMGTLYLINFNQPEGILSVLWLPFEIFLILLIFSLGNLYFSRKG